MSVFILDADGKWYTETKSKDIETGEDYTVKTKVNITDVPLANLFNAWESLVEDYEHVSKKLNTLKEKYDREEFKIVFMSDINFKDLYNSTAEKVRRQHAKNELKDLDKEIKDLELYVDWIKQYVPLLKAVIRSKSDGDF